MLPMGNVVTVEVANGQRNGTKPKLGVPLTQSTGVLAHQRANGTVGHELHDNVDLGTSPKKLLNFDAIRVLQVPYNGQLSLLSTVKDGKKSFLGLQAHFAVPSSHHPA